MVDPVLRALEIGGNKSWCKDNSEDLAKQLWEKCG